MFSPFHSESLAFNPCLRSFKRLYDIHTHIARKGASFSSKCEYQAELTFKKGKLLLLLLFYINKTLLEM